MLKKLFKILPSQFKLQDQFIILLIFSTIIPVFVVGLYGIYSSSNILSEVAKEKMEAESTQEANKINAFLNGVSDDVLLLSKTPPIQGIIRAKENNGTDGQTNLSYNAWVGQLQILFAAMMERKPHYMQLRYIDEKGKEIVRVDSDGGNIKIISAAELQNKGDRPYFIETIKLTPGSIYVSPVDLKQENGQIETPFKPVIRYATPIVDSSGQKRGIVIANVFAKKFIDAFKEVNKQAEEENAYEGKEKFIVNQNGYYISHPLPEKEWGFEFQKEDKLDQDFPPEVTREILNKEKGFIDNGEYLFTFHRVDPSPNQPEFLVVLNKVPHKSVFAAVNSFKLVAFLIIILSLAVVLPLGFIRARQIVNLIKQLVNIISASIQQTFSGLDQQARIAGQQAASVHETTTTMDELEASCRQSTQQAKAATTAAQQALTLAEGGSQAVKETLEGMFILEKKVSAIAAQIVHLSEQANQIASISQIVSDLANQTNMLALNSSVEAVRAGEYGKGFAVVANEIRRLSDQSQKSAEKINVLVSRIQKAINSTVMVTEEGTKTVKTGLENAQKTDQAFAGVADAINYMVVNNQQISLNLKQQLDAIQQVVQAMDIINKGAQETAAGINQTKLGTEQLSDVALTLKRMV
ncbi:methyl-accepting chemotaxis protein [Fischerella thermalis]|uniref:methyl-accepting chemotaxis protein n=1 Tax=Fischerella thermalis TaxID=372787 RepID=UPI0019F90004|nr:methyl-accepting chemotaxis protein [Fischerella thermalis]MBF2071751.1 methyl-accepting chemotaxis protein [Fischerella thermalis M48_A2018_028]